MVAKTAKRPHQPESPEQSQIRLFLPWSKVPMTPSGDNEHGAFEVRWNELVVQVRAEIEALRADDPVQAFRRLMDLVLLIDRTSWARESRGGNDPWMLALREHVSDFLHATLEDGPGTVPDRLLTALLQPDLDLSLVDGTLLRKLSPTDRTDLLDRLRAIEPDGQGKARIQALLTAVLLSEPDVDRLIHTAERLWLWDRVDAAAVLQHLLAEGRAVPHLPHLAARALLEAKAGQDKGRLLNRWLAWCEGNGRADLAQDIRCTLFTRTLDVPFAREWLRHLPPGKDPKHEEAWVLQHVLQHPDRDAALLFLVDWPALDQAVQHVTMHAEQMGELEFGFLQRASMALEAHSPVAALRLMRKGCENYGDTGPRKKAEPWQPGWGVVVPWIPDLPDEDAE